MSLDAVGTLVGHRQKFWVCEVALWEMAGISWKWRRANSSQALQYMVSPGDFKGQRAPSLWLASYRVCKLRLDWCIETRPFIKYYISLTASHVTPLRWWRFLSAHNITKQPKSPEPTCYMLLKFSGEIWTCLGCEGHFESLEIQLPSTCLLWNEMSWKVLEIMTFCHLYKNPSPVTLVPAEEGEVVWGGQASEIKHIRSSRALQRFWIQFRFFVWTFFIIKLCWG